MEDRQTLGLSPSRVRRFGVVAAGAVAVPLFLYAVYTGLTWDLRGGDADRQPGFRTVAVLRGDLPEKVIGTGVTKPRRLVIVQSEIPGVVENVHVDDGDRVERGHTLVELDRDRLESSVAELRAALKIAKARAAYDVVGTAEVDLSEAKEAFERASSLKQLTVVSQEALDNAQHRLDRARIAVSDAKAEAMALSAAVEQAKASLELAERNLKKATIRSPLDGVVVRRQVEVGSAVTDLEHGGTVIAELADDRSIHVLVEVDENDISRVQEGQRADVRIDAFPGEEFEGHVRKVSWSGTGDGTLASFEVELALDPDPRFRVGMSTDVRITVGNHENALLVPNAAIIRSDGGPAVRLVRDGSESHELVSVRSEYSDGFRTAIAPGPVAEGDQVLVMERDR